MTRISRLALGVLTLAAWTLPAAAAPATPSADVAIPQKSASWTWCGWGGGGFFWSCAFDPVNSNVIYLGGDVAGLYKTEDQGRHWHFINHGLQEYGVFSMAVAKNRPETVYAMTGDGIAKSVNGGAAWQPLAATRKGALNLSVNRPGSVRALAIDPRDSETVYAGSGSGVLCKSRDGGQTWTTLDYLRALDLEPKPAVAPLPPAPSGTSFLWMTFASAADDWNHHGRVEKFLSAAGEDWSAYSQLSASFYMPAGASAKVEAQLVVQSGPNWLWQQSPSVTGKPGEWNAVTFDLSGVKNLQAVHIVYLVVRAPGAAFRGDLGLDAVTLHPAAADGKLRLLGDWKKPGSLDGWKAGSHTADAPFISAIRNSADAGPNMKAPIGGVAVAESDPQLIFVAHRTLGLFRSADAGATWRRVWQQGAASSVAVFPGNAKIVYGAFDKHGVWKSVDGGLTWAPTGAGITNACSIREVAVDPRNPEVVHAIGNIGWGGSYYHSRDGGATWQCVRTFARDLAANPTQPDETGSGAYKKEIGGMSSMSNLALSPADPDTLFIAANWSNFLSADGGKTWQERDRGADISCVHDIQFCGTNTYAAAMDEGLFVSSDNGALWRQLTPRKYTPGISGHQWRVRVASVGGTERIVSTVSPWAASQVYPNAVMRSEDGGKTFAKIGTGLPAYLPNINCMWGQGIARALAADPADPNVLYLGIDGDAEPAQGRMGGGIFKSVDGGATWNQLPHQPASRKMFYGLVVDPTDSKRIFWATCGSGLFRSEDGGETWTNVLKYGWLFNVHVSGSGAVYAGDKNLSRSTDHGRTWKQISNFKMDGVLVGIETDPADEKRIWISLTTWDGSSNGGIFRTTDGGATWQEITGDIGYVKPMVLRYNAATRELWAGGVGLHKLTQ